jgi:hypothetical protein
MRGIEKRDNLTDRQAVEVFARWWSAVDLQTKAAKP